MLWFSKILLLFIQFRVCKYCTAFYIEHVRLSHLSHSFSVYVSLEWHKQHKLPQIKTTYITGEARHFYVSFKITRLVYFRKKISE